MNRQGVTLVELLIGMVIMAIVGGALVRLVAGEFRSVEQQEAWRVSRAVTRSGVNRLVSDLRMLELDGAVEAAAADGKSITVRVPYAFGIVCTSTGGTTTTVSLAPADSAMYGSGGFSGFAWRDMDDGTYTYVSSATLAAGSASACTSAGITTLSGGQVVQLTGTVPVGLSAGTVVFLYRRIQYEFKPSTMVAGRTGLWRTQLTGGASEELAAPFDTTARFRFHVPNTAVAQDVVPTPLSSIRGLELQLDGMSETTPRGNSAPKRMSVKTSVYFQNRPD